MVEKNEIIVGLDIGTTKISVIISKKLENGTFEILGAGKSASYGVKRGEVANIDKTVKAIEEAVREAENNSSYQITDVYVGIAGSHIKSMQHRGILTRENSNEEITAKDVKRIIKDMHKLAMEPGMQIIHVIPQEYYIDNLPAGNDPIGMCGSRLEADFHIITGRTAAAHNIERSVKKAGLNMVGLILEPLASAASALDPLEKEAGVVLVDIGGGTTDVAIFKEGIIRHTSVIPFGGNIITEDIKHGCAIIKAQAEQLKVKFGSAIAEMAAPNEIVSIPGLRGREPKEISMQNLAAIIEARMSEIIDQVYYEIQNSGLERQLIAGIVVTGGGSQLKNINQFFEFRTGMDTRVGFPTEHLSAGNEDVTSPMYSTGVGLILKGFERLRVADESNESKKSGVKLSGEKEALQPRKSGANNFMDWIKGKADEITTNMFNDLTD